MIVDTFLVYTAVWFILLLLSIIPLVGVALYTRRKTVQMMKERRLAEQRISEYNKKFQDNYSPFD